MKRNKQQGNQLKKFHEDYISSSEEEDNYDDLVANTNHSQPVTVKAKKGGGGATAMGSFIPNTPKSYPHLHIVSNCVIYCRTSNAKKVYLKDGDSLFEARIRATLDDHNLPMACRNYIENNLRK